MAGRADTHGGKGAKVALPVVNPNPIRGLKIIADINVRKSVSVHIAKHDRKAEVPGRCSERLSLLVEEGAICPGDRRKHSLAIIQIKKIRLPKLNHDAVDDLEALALPSGNLGLAIDITHVNFPAASQDGVFSIVSDVEVQRPVSVDVSQCHRVTAGLER